jgi:hypothetical protein
MRGNNSSKIELRPEPAVMVHKVAERLSSELDELLGMAMAAA